MTSDTHPDDGKPVTDSRPLLPSQEATMRGDPEVDSWDLEDPAADENASSTEENQAPASQEKPLASEDEAISGTVDTEPAARIPIAPRLGSRKSFSPSAPATVAASPEVQKPALPSSLKKSGDVIPSSAASAETDHSHSPAVISNPRSTASAFQGWWAKVKLSTAEKAGFAILIILLMAGMVFFLSNGINRLPEDAGLAGGRRLPVKGKYLSLTKLATFWRAPLSDDGVKKGTQLIPVAEIAIEDGKGALRVLFRNADHQLVGDGMTRTAQGSAHLHIAATAGFEELGMHAAYRAGEAKPWKVEIYEGPSIDAPTDQFQKIYEEIISTETR